MKKKFEIPVIVKYEINLNENIALSEKRIEEIVKGAQWYFSHEVGGQVIENDSRCFKYVSQNTSDPDWNMITTHAIDMSYANFLVWITTLIRDALYDDRSDNDYYAHHHSQGGCTNY